MKIFNWFRKEVTHKYHYKLSLRYGKCIRIYKVCNCCNYRQDIFDIEWSSNLSKKDAHECAKIIYEYLTEKSESNPDLDDEIKKIIIS